MLRGAGHDTPEGRPGILVRRRQRKQHRKGHPETQQVPLTVTYRQALCKFSWFTAAISGLQLSIVLPNLDGKGKRAYS